MQAYANKSALMSEIQKAAALFLSEFEGISEADKALRLEGVDRTPEEIIAYQLGWMKLLLGWDQSEQDGKEVVTPAPGYKWNQLGGLYQSFYAHYQGETLADLTKMFSSTVGELLQWLEMFEEDELFVPGGRKWASSTPANWPVWKWVHINTVAPFRTFRAKIRKWKKLRKSNGLLV